MQDIAKNSVYYDSFLSALTICTMVIPSCRCRVVFWVPACSYHEGNFQHVESKYKLLVGCVFICSDEMVYFKINDKMSEYQLKFLEEISLLLSSGNLFHPLINSIPNFRYMFKKCYVKK